MLGFRAERLSTLWAKCLKGGLECLFHSVLLRISWMLVWIVGDDNMGM